MTKTKQKKKKVYPFNKKLLKEMNQLVTDVLCGEFSKNNREEIEINPKKERHKREKGK